MGMAVAAIFFDFSFGKIDYRPQRYHPKPHHHLGLNPQHHRLHAADEGGDGDGVGDCNGDGDGDGAHK